MSDTPIPPALTPEQWKNVDRFGCITLGDVSNRLAPRIGAGPDPKGNEFSVQDDWGEASACPLPVAIAVANDALESDDPRKITWEWVDALREEYNAGSNPSALLPIIANALASYLPQRPRRVLICDRSDPANHPFGMWWDDYTGEEFPVVALHEGVPRQWEVDVSSLQASGKLAESRAFIPESYAVERGGHYIGYIDFLDGRVETFEDAPLPSREEPNG